MKKVSLLGRCGRGEGKVREKKERGERLDIRFSAVIRPIRIPLVLHKS
jgi:hypothetical protein